ncbi:hypothetical protein SmJEL517_g02952 [Synchytrium microbalum]|uniref:Growth arrest-specific protein 8 domain-containing protein n=1 Tax=Synchytrium microbalum TaxID=1806994 RepID=A0A507C4I0_9FUNG|nr:uncharacterized protein SmJEL517_g02952 [Synchytrium microbalum]TPX34391.1 hypothetical protein SmJEL517_g02952 [Synchytrium microbalum]
MSKPVSRVASNTALQNTTTSKPPTGAASLSRQPSGSLSQSGGDGGQPLAGPSGSARNSTTKLKASSMKLAGSRPNIAASSKMSMSASGAAGSQALLKKSRNGSTSGPSTTKPSSPGKDPAVALAEWEEEKKKVLEESVKQKEERNFYQLERDKIADFWEISKQELVDTRAELLNKDRELEEQEEKHQVEIKVYKQKVKHLLYEYQNNVAHLQADSERALQHDQDEHAGQEAALRRDSRALSLELRERSLVHEAAVRDLKLKHDAEIAKLRADFDRHARELHARYERRSKNVREELEVKRKAEIHEVEERKNGQINALMRGHEKAFAEIKNYYNDITLNNLALINSLKEQVEEMKKKEERSEKLMADITAENKRLSEPLTAALNECESLKRQLLSHEKDRQALASTKARLKVTEEKFKQLEWEHEVLTQRFERAQKERDELYEEFVERIQGVQQKTAFKNLILEKKVESLRENLERKDLQLSEVLRASNLDPVSIGNITKRLEEVLESKNSQVRELQYDLAKTTKAYNDMMRVYEAKLGEYAIPVEELGFKPIQPRSTVAAAAQ